MTDEGTVGARVGAAPTCLSQSNHKYTHARTRLLADNHI
jgi:hypothetical protein